MIAMCSAGRLKPGAWEQSVDVSSPEKARRVPVV